VRAPGRVSATGMPGPIVTRPLVALRLLPDQGRLLGHRAGDFYVVQRLAGLRDATEDLLHLCLPPPAQNMVSVPSIAAAPAGPISRASRSAFDAGAGFIDSIGEARLVIRLGTSSPGRSSARGIIRRPGSASSSRRSSGVQRMVGSSIWRSVTWIGLTPR